MAAVGIVKRAPDVNVCGHCNRPCPRGTYLATDGIYYGRACMARIWKVTGGQVERAARFAEVKARRDAKWAEFRAAYPAEADHAEQLRAAEVERCGVVGIAGEAIAQFSESHIDPATVIQRLALAEEGLR